MPDVANTRPAAGAPAGELDRPLPAPWIRSTVGILLFVHLFALATGVVSMVPNASPLARRLGNVPGLREYREVLLMELSYGYHLTYADAYDVDNRVTAEITLADGARETVALEPEGIVLPDRKLRYQRLAQQLSETTLDRRNNLNPDEEPEARLAQAIATWMLEQAGAKRLVLTSTGRLLPFPADYDPENPQSGYRDEVRYRAHAFRSDGQTRVMRAEESGETAPPPTAR